MNKFLVWVPDRSVSACFDSELEAIKFAYFFGGERALLFVNGILKQIIEN